MNSKPRVGKQYRPLYDHLVSLPAHVRKWWLTFDQIEILLGRGLPQSAYNYGQWWANDITHTHARAWLEAGWETARQAANVGQRKMEFVRQ